MTNKKLVFIGYGQHADVLYEIAKLNDYEVIGYTDMKKRSTLLPYLGLDQVIELYSIDEIKLVLAMGSIQAEHVRSKLFVEWKRKGYHFETLIHPSAIISETAKIGEGAQIMAGVVIQPHVAIGQNVIVNTKSSIDHHTTLAHHVHIAPNVTVCGSVHIQQGTHIGAGATVIQSIVVGSFTTVGAGAVVLKDVLDHQKVVGIPAKEV